MAANSDLQRPNFSIEDVHSASEGKSFDYRLLNYLLYSIRKVEPDRQLIDFLFLDEHLVDIGDDLHDYEVITTPANVQVLHPNVMLSFILFAK